MGHAGKYSKGEELANAISHLVGAVLATAALVLLVVYSSIYGTAIHIVSTAIFGTSMILLYLSSMFTHWLRDGKTKELFFVFDQAAIFMLIAGTYTPLALVTLKGPFGWVLFGLEWAMAIAGIIMVSRPQKYKRGGVRMLNIVIYAAMGWLLVIAIVPIVKVMPVMGWVWILIGGLCYTFGIYFYKKATFKYAHLVWHILVIAGSLSHFFAIFFYVIPIRNV